MPALTRRSLGATILLSGAMLLASLPVLAQDETSGQESDRADLAAMLPAEVSGRDLETTSWSFEELAGLMDPSDEEQAAAVAGFEELAASLGVGLDGAFFGSASAAEAGQGVIIFVLRVPGQEGTELVEPLIGLLEAVSPGVFPPLMEMEMEQATVGGKDVTLIGIDVLLDGEYDGSGSVGYGTGDTAVFMQGDEASVLEVLAALP